MRANRVSMKKLAGSRRVMPRRPEVSGRIKVEREVVMILLFIKSALYFKVLGQKKYRFPMSGSRAGIKAGSWLVNSPDHILQGLEVLLERFFPRLGDRIGGIGLSPDKALVHFDKAILFQVDQVRGQVTVRQFQQLLEIVEANLLIHQQDAHDPHPDATIKDFIEISNRILHDFSYFHHMISP
jgi:hypothetical protein